MYSQDDIQYALESTKVLLEPDRRIDTFGRRAGAFQNIMYINSYRVWSRIYYMYDVLCIQCMRRSRQWGAWGGAAPPEAGDVRHDDDT